MHVTLSEFIVDCFQNSLEAGAGMVYLLLDETDEGFRVQIKDDGRGMSEEQIDRALDPFYSDGTKHKKRRFGLGLPFLKQAVDQTGGAFYLSSEPGVGTTVDFRFPAKHVDSPPKGDLTGLYLQLVSFTGRYNCVVERRIRVGGRSDEYSFSREELIEVLGDLSDSESLSLAREFFRSQEIEIIGGNHGQDDP